MNLGFGSASGHGRRTLTAVVTSMSKIQAEPVEWFWQDRIPYGNLTIVAGNPGQGKSVLCIDLAARASTGRRMPFTPPSRDPISVLLLTAEDGLTNTVKPRLMAAKADMDRVFVLEGVRRNEDGAVVQLMSIPDEIPQLKEAIVRTGARLVIIDVLDVFLADNVNSHENHSIRRALTPLKMLAEESSAGIVAICHLNKNSGSRENPLYRVGGSIGNTGAARSVLLVAPDPEDQDSRVLAPVKANLSPMPKSLSFHLEQGVDDHGVHIRWDGFSDLTKDNLLVPPRAQAKDQAMAFLLMVLGDNPLPHEMVMKKANEQGIRERTLRRAADDLGIVKTHIDPPGGYWQWSLPNNDDGDSEVDEVEEAV